MHTTRELARALDKLDRLRAQVTDRLNAPESGTAIKSSLMKLISPTAEGLAAASKLGLRRSDYTEGLGKADPYKATKQLKATMPQLQGKAGLELFKMMDAARKAGTLGDEKTLEKLIRFAGKKAGAKTQADWDEVTGRVHDALTAGGGTIDAFKFLQDLSRKFNSGEASLTDLSKIFDPRQVSRLIPVLKLMPEIEKLVAQQKELSGGILEKGQQVYDESSFGKMERALASFQRTMVKLRDSPAVAGVIEMLATLGDKFSALSPGLVKATTGLALVGAAAGPVMWMAGNIGRLLIGGSAGLRVFGGAVLAAGVGMAAWAGRMARIAAVIGTLSRLRGVLFGLRALLVGGGPLGLAIAAVSTLAMNFREVWAAAQGFYDGFVSKFAVGSELSKAFTNLGLALIACDSQISEPWCVGVIRACRMMRRLVLADAVAALAALCCNRGVAACRRPTAAPHHLRGDMDTTTTTSDEAQTHDHRDAGVGDRFLPLKQLAPVLGVSAHQIVKMEAKGVLALARLPNGVPGLWLSQVEQLRRRSIEEPDHPDTLAAIARRRAMVEAAASARRGRRAGASTNGTT